MAAAKVDFAVSRQNKLMVATCNLNQWALDWDDNLKRIESSIRIAKKLGARFRLGPELEISGYSCEDHFRETDTYLHAAQSLAALLKTDATDDILCDIGMPLMHLGVKYNCRVLCLNRRIVYIRPKTFLANDGNYHEPRFFASWKGGLGDLSSHLLCDELREATGQTHVPIGVGIIQTQETRIADEVCEELFVTNSPHIEMALAGVEIFCNGSGSHHQLRKLNDRLTLMTSATGKNGGAYLYANVRGCDGTRLYFDGCSVVVVNGHVRAQASQFSLKDVEVVTAVIDLDDIRSYRSNIGSMQEAASLALVDRSRKSKLLDGVVDLSHFSLRPQPVARDADTGRPLERAGIMITSPPVQPVIHSPEEECALGPACWLWDYLRRSGAAGYFLPLSGGADSASVATITRVMCDLVVQEVVAGEVQVQSDLKRLSPAILAEILACAAPVASSSAAASTASTAVSLSVQEEDRGRSKSIAAGGAGGAAASAVPVIRGSTPPRVSSPPPTDRTGEGENQLVVFRRMDSHGSVDEFEGTWRPVQGKFKELAKKLCGTILHTTYIATVNNHSDTRNYAQELSETYGSYHCLLHIDTIVSSVLSCLGAIQGSAAAVGRIISPRYKSQGGCDAEDLALQNIQARLRMVMSYLCAALLPWIRGGCGQTSNGFLLVLGSGNVDEALRGYFTKYDCSSADLNPIGGICKKDLKKLLVWAAKIMDCPAVGKIICAPPTAELRPLSHTSAGTGIGTGASRVVLEQTDEEDMGMSYDDLSVFGYLRKVRQCGPLSMFHKLCEQWRLSFTPRVIADKVKHFFKFYAINRHKLTTLTPSYHAENYSPDDNRYDFRPFLYPVRWSRSFANIDACVADLEMRPAIGRGI